MRHHARLYFLFGNRASLSCGDWPQTCDPSVSASQVLGLQACATMPGLRVFLLKGKIQMLVTLTFLILLHAIIYQKRVLSPPFFVVLGIEPRGILPLSYTLSPIFYSLF